MKKLLLLLCLFTLSVPGRAEESAAPGARLGLVALGRIDNALVEHAADWVRLQTGMEVKVMEPLGKALSDLDTASIQAVGMVSKQTPLVVALVGGTNQDKQHGRLLYDEHAALVNLAGLMEGTEENPALVKRRLERLVLSSYGFLLGMTYCPDPHCVMHRYDTLEKLDKMGRNFCPPNRQTFETAAAGLGIQRVPPETP